MSESVSPWDLFKKSQPRSIEGVREARISICEGCEYFFKVTRQCKKCACFMDAKTKLRYAECPLGKW